jgi:LmbE family N-acetylglucosaminyl deacetylase
MKVMFCGAHPDDAEIYSFGTLFAYAEKGAEVVLVLATSGEGGTKMRSPHQPLAITRLQEAENAASMLFARLVPLGLPDGGLKHIRAQLFQRLQQLIDDEKPDIILTHSPNDYHADHRILSCAVALAASDTVPVLFIDNMKGNNFAPTHYVNITKYQAQKMLALRQHYSQKPMRYMRAATELAKQRGFEATGKKGILMEAFRFAESPAYKAVQKLFPRGTIPAPAVIFQYQPDVPDTQTAPTPIGPDT